MYLENIILVYLDTTYKSWTLNISIFLHLSTFTYTYLVRYSNGHFSMWYANSTKYVELIRMVAWPERMCPSNRQYVVGKGPLQGKGSDSICLQKWCPFGICFHSRMLKFRYPHGSISFVGPLTFSSSLSPLYMVKWPLIGNWQITSFITLSTKYNYKLTLIVCFQPGGIGIGEWICRQGVWMIIPHSVEATCFKEKLPILLSILLLASRNFIHENG